MIFKQLFDGKSSTYTYIISSGEGREALIIDPVIEHTDEYIKVLTNLKLKLVKVIDTHIHADHITGLNELNKRTNCTRIMGEKSKSEVIDLKIKDNEKIKVENIELKAIYTPGHTDCSYSYLMNDRVFTGDTLLINGTGRTDFQNGNPYDAYDSLFNKLLKITPGVKLFARNDDQKRVTFAHNALQDGANFVVIGRELIESNKPQDLLKKYGEQHKNKNLWTK